MKLTHLIILSLATYRLSYMVSSEDGPWRVFSKLRKAPPVRSGARQWLSCPFCFSVTAAAVLSLLWMTEEPAAVWFVSVLAISGAAVVIHQALKGT